MRPISELYVGKSVKVVWASGDRWNDRAAEVLGFDHTGATIRVPGSADEHHITWRDPLAYIANDELEAYGPVSSEVLEITTPELE